MTSLAGGVRYPTIKFAAFGDTVQGTIIEAEDIPELDYTTRQPKFWQDGNPITQILVNLELPDGSRGSLYVYGARRKAAVRDALRRARCRDLEPGGELSMTLTGEEPGKNGKMANTWQATYTPAPEGTGTTGSRRPSFVPDDDQQPPF